MPKSARQRSLDRPLNIIEGTAMSASLLCLAHCLALPLLLLLLPGALGLFARSEAFHLAALALAAPAALTAFWFGYRRHRALAPALLGLTGLCGLALALLPWAGEGAETAFTVAGSAALLIGHMGNWQRRRREEDESGEGICQAPAGP